MYASLTLSGMNITMLVNFFSLSLLPLFSGVPSIGQSGAKPGVVQNRSQPPTNFYGFHIKNSRLNTLFIEKELTVRVVMAVSNRHF